MKEKILDILEELCPGTEVDKCETLIDDGVIDSFDVINLVGELMESFEVEIGAEYIVPENFNSIESMIKMIEKLKNE